MLKHLCKFMLIAGLITALSGCLSLGHLNYKQARMLKKQGFTLTEEGWTLRLPEKLLFGFDQSDIQASQKPALEALSKQLQQYSQTTLLFIQDSKKTRNNSSTESINHSLRLRLTHAHMCSIGFKSGLYAGSQRILCPCCSNNS